MTIEEWHQKIRDAQAALDVALRGELPTEGQTQEVAMIRGFIGNLDTIVFRGFDLLRPKDVPMRVRKPRPECNISLEDLFG